MIADRLTIVGQSTPDHDFVFYALGGLDSNMKSFISSITLRPIPISFDELHSHLFAHWVFLIISLALV